MKYSTTKIPPANMKNSAGKVSVNSPRLRKSQQKGEEICQVYFMQLRSGLIIKKKACYFRKETTKRHSRNSAEDCQEPNLLLAACQTRLQHFEQSTRAFAVMVQDNTGRGYYSRILERSFSLSTYNDQSITFAFSDGSYEIFVEDLRKNDEKDKVLLHYYDSQLPASETGETVDGHKIMVTMSPAKNKDFLLHANNKEHSVELQRYENSLPDPTLFLLHSELRPSPCVSFECRSNPGVFLGVKNNRLALIKLKDQTEHSRRNNIKFKLS